MSFSNQFLNNFLFRQFIETTNEGIWVIDNTLNSIYVNDQVLKITETDLKDILGRKISEFIWEDDLKTFNLQFANNKDNDIRRVKLRLRSSNGNPKWILLSLSPIEEHTGGFKGYLIMFSDISDQKFKSLLLSNINQELRNPMNGILGFTEILQESVNDPVHQKITSSILHSGKRLMNTLNAIIDLADIEDDQSKLDLEICDISEITDHVVKRYELDATKKGLEFIVSTQSRLYANIDRTFFKRILECLTDNALKFTFKGKIEITTRQFQEGDNLFVGIQVSDTGAGIDPENHQSVFEEFKQGKASSEYENQGAGIGLSLSKKMVLLMGGMIRLESELGVGSTFTVLFPESGPPAIPDILKEQEEISVEPDLLHSGSAKVPLVLIVEDNKFNIELIEIYLKGHYHVDKASDGLTAIRLATTKQFQAILMDINLGIGMDGMRTTKEIRRIPGYENVPVFAITGYTTREEKERLAESGLNYYLAKPFDRKKLLSLLAEALGKQQ
jgi:PAS domain S-box-containing protein